MHYNTLQICLTESENTKIIEIAYSLTITVSYIQYINCILNTYRTNHDVFKGFATENEQTHLNLQHLSNDFITQQQIPNNYIFTYQYTIEYVMIKIGQFKLFKLK